jgi:hypothetical protein
VPAEEFGTVKREQQCAWLEIHEKPRDHPRKHRPGLGEQHGGLAESRALADEFTRGAQHAARPVRPADREAAHLVRERLIPGVGARARFA